MSTAEKAVVEEPQVELKHGNRSRRCPTETVSNGRHRWPCCENRQGPPRGTHPHDLIWYFFNRVPLQFLTVLPGTESLHYDAPQGRKWAKNLHSWVWEDKSHCTNLQSWQLRMSKELQVRPSQHTRTWIRDSPDYQDFYCTKQRIKSPSWGLDHLTGIVYKQKWMCNTWFEVTYDAAWKE